jgi:hypothetical protein
MLERLLDRTDDGLLERQVERIPTSYRPFRPSSPSGRASVGGFH